MLLLLSHKLTEEQKESANADLNVREFLEMPEELRNLWKNIPPTKPSLSDCLKPLRKWIKENADPKDYVLIQGDFGATYSMVNYAFSVGLIPVYSTTERNVVEKQLSNNTVKTERIFQHKIFRRYEMEVECNE